MLKRTNWEQRHLVLEINGAFCFYCPPAHKIADLPLEKARNLPNIFVETSALLNL